MQFSIERVNILCGYFSGRIKGESFKFWHEFIYVHTHIYLLLLFFILVHVLLLPNCFFYDFFFRFDIRFILTFFDQIYNRIQIANGFTQFWSNDYRICYVHNLYTKIQNVLVHHTYEQTHTHHRPIEHFIETKCFYKDIILLLHYVFFHSFPPFTNKPCVAHIHVVLSNIYEFVHSHFHYG